MSKNLIPFTERSKDEVRELNKKGGINSGIARRNKKTIREELEIMLELMEEGQTNREIVSAALLMKAKKGDTKAFELLRDTVGEKPVDKQEMTGSMAIQNTYAELSDEEIEERLAKYERIEKGS